MSKRQNPTSLDFEIVNVVPLNKYISECEIKVLYHGKNRNGSYISKPVANEMAHSLPRTPIVAFYNEQVEDFEDHGEEVIINKSGIKFIKKTMPYGAVDKDTPVVWKKFLDDKGEEKEYLVVKGFLWTGRYPFLQKVLDSGKGQSMELFPESVNGNWAKFDNDNDEFFIFNEADISALCILGDDVEPCFEDSTITKPEILYSLKQNEFKQEFNNFMLELNKVLDHSNTEGGITVEKDNKDGLVIEDGLRQRDDVLEDPKTPELDNEAKLISVSEQAAAIAAKREAEEDEVETITKTEEDVKEEEEQPEVIVENEQEVITEEPQVLEEDPVVENDNEEFTNLKNSYDATVAELSELKEQFNLLMEEKTARETQEKEAICDKFSVLGEETINEFKNNLSNYSAIELEKELSAIAFNKGITFNLLTQKEDSIVTPIPVRDTKVIPAWLQAIEDKAKADQ